jgi:uncharacterized membrane protein YdjX (TVP38/TMEM64 family)
MEKSGHPISDPVPARSERSARHILLFAGPKRKRTWWIAGTILALVVALVVVLLLNAGLNWAMFAEYSSRLNAVMERFNAAAVLPMMAVLPIFGFPIGLVYLVAGARFGPLWGGIIVAGATMIHLLGSYLIARSFLRAPIERFVAKRGQRLPAVPEDEQVLVCVIAALVPGIPYVLRNFALALAGIRRRYLLGVVLPIYVARSYVTIMLGDLSGDPSRSALIILFSVDALKVAVCACVIWRLRAHHRKFHADHSSGALAPHP